MMDKLLIHKMKKKAYDIGYKDAYKNGFNKGYLYAKQDLEIKIIKFIKSTKRKRLGIK